jgi:hypothetical protein
MQELLRKLSINEEFTRPIRKPDFDSVKANTYPRGGFNFMCDLLHLPTTKYRYKYLFVIVDLWSNAFDIEAIRTKTPEDVLKALKKVLTRQYIPDVKASMRTDSGTEFKGIFHKWLYDNNVLQRVAEPKRHQQMANVDNLIKTLGRLLNGYMNAKEEQTGKVYKQWTDVIDIIRNDLNDLRIRNDGNPQTDLIIPPTNKMPKFKIGDMVYYKSERPRNAFGEMQPTDKFRQGDYRYNITDIRKITNILYYPKNIRYLLDNKNNVSYTESELKLKK